MRILKLDRSVTGKQKIYWNFNKNKNIYLLFRPLNMTNSAGKDSGKKISVMFWLNSTKHMKCYLITIIKQIKSIC